MNAPEFSPCRSKLRRISDSPFSCPAALPSFFERLIEEADGAGLGGDGCGAEVRLGASGPLPGEREEDFEMRRRDFATEMGISFDRWPYSLEDKFAAGDALFREKQYKQVGAAMRKAESLKNKSKKRNVLICTCTGVPRIHRRPVRVHGAPVRQGRGTLL